VLITYDRVHDAIEAAQVTEDAGLAEAVLVPRPRTLAARCGVALRMPSAIAREAVGLLIAAGRLGAVYCGKPKEGWRPCPTGEIMEA
jgi:hypothetical protein